MIGVGEIKGRIKNLEHLDSHKSLVEESNYFNNYISYKNENVYLLRWNIKGYSS